MGSYQFKGRSRFGFKSKEILTILILDAYFCVLSSFFFFFWSTVERLMCFWNFAVNICLEIKSKTMNL